MNIQLNFTPKSDSLAKASMLYLEKKPIIGISIWLLNGLCFLVALALCLKWGLTGQMFGSDILVFIVAILWLGARRSMILWMLQKRLKNNQAITLPLRINLSSNGISWGGDKLQSGSVQWDKITRIFKMNNGYVLPVSGTRFIWTPLSAYKDEQVKVFEAFCVKKNIEIKLIRRTC